MNTLIQTLALGLAQGSMYSLIALGYTLVYGIIELINFAHGDVFMVGSFISLFALQTIFGASLSTFGGFQLVGAILVAFLIAMASCAVIGVTIERFAYRPLRGAPRLAPLVTAIGVSLILENLVQLIQGGNTSTYPPLIAQTTITIAGTPVNSTVFVVIVSALVLMLGLDVLVNRTKVGRAMRAVAQDREAAMMMGVDVNRTIAITFIIGSALAGAAGVVYGMYFNNITWNMGYTAGLKAFTAAVLGGIGNIRGAMLGGLMIGVLETWVGLQQGGRFLQWSQIAVFSVLILVLIFRPSGLLGTRVIEKA